MTDNDRELLALAAKACSLDMADKDIRRRWNPLESDGDAFRLAVQLRIETRFLEGFKQVQCNRDSDRNNFERHGLIGYGNGACPEPTAENVRRAIVRAAAEIGRGMV